MDGAPVLIPFISFLNSVLLMDEPCKFMLKYEIKNYFRQFTEILSEKFNVQRNKTHTDLVICSTLIVKCLCQIWNSCRLESFFYWIKLVTYIS